MQASNNKIIQRFVELFTSSTAIDHGYFLVLLKAGGPEIRKIAKSVLLPVGEGIMPDFAILLPRKGERDALEREYFKDSKGHCRGRENPYKQEIRQNR